MEHAGDLWPKTVASVQAKAGVEQMNLAASFPFSSQVSSPPRRTLFQALYLFSRQIPIIVLHAQQQQGHGTAPQ